MLKKRRLGKMGFEASILTLGGAGIGRITQPEADKAIEKAFKYGVNMLDIAPSYGDSELRVASWVQKYRDKIFLAEKTAERTQKGALKELQNSLKRIGAKQFDLYQMHHLGNTEELEQALGKNGAIETFKTAKETGIIRHLGITGHENMQILKEALTRYDFDSVLLPVTLCSMAKPHPENDFRPVLKEAADRGIAAIAIKSIARRRWPGEQRYKTWYEPSDTPKDIELAVRYTLSQEPVKTYSLPSDVRLWDMVLEAADRFTPMDQDEQKEAVKYARENGFTPLFPT